MDYLEVPERPVYPLARNLGYIVFSLILFTWTAFFIGKHHKQFVEGVSSLVRPIAETPMREYAGVPSSSGGEIDTLTVESRAGRGTIYLDQTTGTRVLCAEVSTCVPLPTPHVVSSAQTQVLTVESEAGLGTIYLDKRTGARVLCAVRSTCFLLPVMRESSK